MKNFRPGMAMIGAAVVILLMLTAGYFVSTGPDTAEIAEPKPTDTVQDLPAGRATGNEQPTGSVNP